MKKKKKYVWNHLCTLALNTLKQRLISAPILRLCPDFNLPFYIECDASNNGIGGVLI